MGSKRKIGGKPPHTPEVEGYGDYKTMLAINSWEDVADSGDEFHLNRDKIFLDDGPVKKRRRKLQEQEEFLELSDEEVLAEAEENSEDANDDSEGDLEDGETEMSKRGSVLARPPIHDRVDSETSALAEDAVDAGDWGMSKREYYNADVIETEADAVEEEREAIRLQRKHLENMTEADFGFDESEWLDASKADGREDNIDEDRVFRESLPQLQLTDAMGPEERRKILSLRYPEFEPLANEFVGLQAVYEELSRALADARLMQGYRKHASNGSLNPDLATLYNEVARVRYSALSTYLASLSMYFALLTSCPSDTNGLRIPKSTTELRNHPIMSTLMECRGLWERVKELRDQHNSEPVLDNVSTDVIAVAFVEQGGGAISGGKERVNILEGKGKRRKQKKTKFELAAENALAESEARRAARISKTEEDLKQLSNIVAPAKRSPESAAVVKHQPLANDDDSDFGEETSLTAYEAAEKAQRRKTLRFYTSQIVQKASKRGNAGRDAGGDADIPFRERLRDKQARLNAEAESRAKKRGTTRGEVLGGDSDDDDRTAAQEIRAGGADEDYYDLVTDRSKQKKASKAALAAAELESAREGGVVHVVEQVGPDGKRAITYQIEKNKGLTPKRKKDVRNPRVKKRKKYEEKKKKLGSIKQIYKGGEGRGGYGGELTGIKKSLVRSVKL